MLLRVVVVCLLSAWIVNAVSLDLYEGKFVDFIKQFNKNYDEVSYNKRLKIFKDNLQYIEDFNAKNSQMQMGINDMTDMTHEEYLQLLQTTDPKQNLKINNLPPLDTDLGQFPTLPQSVDWRNQSDVAPVVDMRPCSGPAYAVVGTVQSFCSITAGTFDNYNPQQVVQCSQGSCSNASEEQIFDYVAQNGLHDTWNNCNVSRDMPGCCITDHICFGGLEMALTVAVAVMGPTVVAIDASQPSFKNYKTGIYTEPACSSTNLNFNLLVVGYGANPQGQYWIAQNYWGPTWGQNGYIFMPRNQNNTCGIASHPCHPVGVHQCVR